MRSIASFVPSVPTTPTSAPVCVSAVDASSSDALPWAPQGNISQWDCPHLLQFTGGGSFKSMVHPLLLVRIAWSPTCEILAYTWSWYMVQGTCDRCLWALSCPVSELST